LTTRVTPLTVRQAIPAVLPVSVEAQVTAASPLIAHTCPAGKRQRCFAAFIVTIWGGTGRNLRCRIQGVQIKQLDDTNHPLNSAFSQFVTPEFLLDSGDTVSVTTQNAGTEGGTIRVSVIIKDEVSA